MLEATHVRQVLRMQTTGFFGSIIIFLVLFLLSAFFSGSETAMMSLNRYRMRHSARKGNRRAKQILELLKRPDRLLGMILLGNTFCNILVSSVVTLTVSHYYGAGGVLIATVALTLFILIFAETAPKTVAAYYPSWFAKKVSGTLFLLLKVLYPLVWFINLIANNCLRLLGMKIKTHGDESLSNEELGTLVREASGQLSNQYRDMLLSILSLEQVDVGDVLVPRHEIVGIDLEQPLETIQLQLQDTRFGYLPVYREHIDRIEGVLRVQDLVTAAVNQLIDKETILKLLREPYFIPETAQLSQQLIYFQQKNKQMGLVVDEYGDIIGLITLQDVLEEIVGQFAGNMAPAAKMLQKQDDDSYVIDAGIGVRDLNRLLGWHLPVDGPNTLSGLIINQLESIPSGPQILFIEGHRIEIMDVEDTTVGQVRVWAVEKPNELNETGDS
jgi:Mg2+/Co2+ transporter CorB